eukprot:scaffold138525_cov22-Tisochrysis_lutea.AAC.2
MVHLLLVRAQSGCFLHYTQYQHRQSPNSVQKAFVLICFVATTGSEYKVDASYLSPNVNIASRLEAATKQFGVSLLMSQVRLARPRDIGIACALHDAIHISVHYFPGTGVCGLPVPHGAQPSTPSGQRVCEGQ